MGSRGEIRGGWRRLGAPRREGAAAFVLSPFTRLARTHALAVAGDTLIALALADSLFFSIDPTDARVRVFGYLALTMAPFAIVAPLIGPALDRAHGGRRWMVVGAQALRAGLCLLLVDDIDSLLLFPEAFGLLVMAKSYHVAKSALVPTTVSTDSELVTANSRLSLISGIMGFVAAVPGGLLLWLGGSRWVLGLAVLVFIAGAVLALRLPPTQVAPEPASPEERAELRSGIILLSATAMGLLRGIVGFLTFLLAFDLRGGDAPSWHFGVVLALSAGGAVTGAAIAPMLRRSTTEERILTSLLGLTTAGGLVTAYVGGLAGAAVIAGTVGVCAAAGKLAFDAIVQRDAPDANRGRSFARFETRFQLIWVVGAIIPVVLPIPARAGYLVVAATAGFALLSYIGGSRQLHRLHPDPAATSSIDPTTIDPTTIDPTTIDRTTIFDDDR